MGSGFRDRFQSHLHHPFHVLIPDLAWGSGAMLIEQAFHSASDEPLSPKSNRKTGGLQLLGHGNVGLTAGALQNDLGPESKCAMQTALLHQSSQFLNLGILHYQFLLLGSSARVGHAPSEHSPIYLRKLFLTHDTRSCGGHDMSFPYSRATGK